MDEYKAYIGPTILNHIISNSAMWKYLNGLNDHLLELAKFTETSTETVKQLLKKPPGKTYVH